MIVNPTRACGNRSCGPLAVIWPEGSETGPGHCGRQAAASNVAGRDVSEVMGLGSVGPRVAADKCGNEMRDAQRGCRSLTENP